MVDLETSSDLSQRQGVINPFVGKAESLSISRDDYIGPAKFLTRQLSHNQPEPILNPAAALRLSEAFAASTACGLELLAGEFLRETLPPTFVFWRSLAQTCFTTVCHHPDPYASARIAMAQPDDPAWERWVESAPPMKGIEYLSATVVARFWDQLDQRVRAEIARTPGGPAAYFQAKNPVVRTKRREGPHPGLVESGPAAASADQRAHWRSGRESAGEGRVAGFQDGDDARRRAAHGSGAAGHPELNQRADTPQGQVGGGGPRQTQGSPEPLEEGGVGCGTRRRIAAPAVAAAFGLRAWRGFQPGGGKHSRGIVARRRGGRPEKGARGNAKPGRGGGVRSRPGLASGIASLPAAGRPLALVHEPASCLADDVGLGKTIQVLSLLLVLKRHASANPLRPTARQP